MNTVVKVVKAISELGLQKLWYYTLYRVGLRSGIYRHMTPIWREAYSGPLGLPPISTVPHVSPSQRELVLAQADEICKGLVRLFGGEPVLLDLELGCSPDHWTRLEQVPPDQDIKFIWESGRLGWAITLARAYAFSGESSYAQDFWDKTIHFLDLHPPNMGRQWQSAQEVAIRLMVMVLCDQVVTSAPSSSQENRERLWQAVAEHAKRISVTLLYARAQNNNHLLTEAAGLYTAGVYLPGHPEAQKWQQIGRHWVNRALQKQINEDGTYIQHSSNYHRLMLQVALFVEYVRQAAGEPDWHIATKVRLDAATRWLWALTDPHNGRVPNLGANDGAYIFPLTACAHHDFRPVVDAAAKAFIQQDVYKRPDLAEMADWLNFTETIDQTHRQPHAQDMLRVESKHGRAFIHTAHFYDRPSHADQLHIDLWWNGVNVSRDPGTYSYNAKPPWDNALATAKVHNTLTLNQQDHMLRVGKFLWLDWAQAEVLAYDMDEQGRLVSVTAEQDAYQNIKLRHQRTLAVTDSGWDVTDRVLPFDNQTGHQVHEARLTWLMPDWTWMMESNYQVHLTGPGFAVQVEIEGSDQINLYRAGECLHGAQVANPTWGWFSPTYGVKEPALMLVAVRSGAVPIEMHTRWHFILPGDQTREVE